MTNRPLYFFLIIMAGILACATPAMSGGPLVLNGPGDPFLWPNGGTNIPFNPDQGGLGPLTNAEAVAQTTASFAAWQAITTATATHVNAGTLPIDVDETNFDPFFSAPAPDGLSAIVYDEDGAIFELLFGPDSGILGFAGPEWLDASTGTIVEGLAFMNGGSLLGPGAFPVAEFLSVQVHEFGHYQNLAHTVVNGQIPLGDNSGPTPNDTFPIPSLVDKIETMYPFLFINGGQATPHPDDIAIFSTLYPEPGFFGSTASISGKILGPNGTTPLTGVNVIARNVLNPFDDAVSAISSDFTDDFTPGAPFVGDYNIHGLTPDAEYAVFVDEIFAGGFSTPPRILPGPEEFYNGANESNNGNTDDPSVFTAVSAAAGGTATGINIIFNAIAPGPLLIGDEESIELFFPFSFEFCGQKHDSAFVNDNGTLTFGQPQLGFDFLETVQSHLGGPPRIAGLWEDYDPSAGGVVAFEQSLTKFTVSWTNVPEFLTTNSNTFKITLWNDENGQFSVHFGNLDATGGLAGYSCGGRITSAFELESNLRKAGQSGSRFINARGSAAIFELFSAGDNDLDNFITHYSQTSKLNDKFEPNNAFSQATRVSLPFNAPGKYTAIEPLGGDVDFYKFKATAGQIFVAELVPGNQVDTLLGLFDKDGNLLALNDDGGAFGLGGLSRLAVIIPATDKYFIGVTSWPDFDFNGDGGLDFGRYVLSLNTYNGTIVGSLIDDESVEIPFGFNFPYQGSNWNSVFVNSNGNLTFGVGDADFSESVAEFLSGPPRIAPLWDDLFPGDGLMISELKGGSLTIHFASVPEFLSLRPNYFSVRIENNGEVNFRYRPTARGDALVGLTPGNGATDPGPTDLSAQKSLSAVGTTYELFPPVLLDFSSFDLFFETFEFDE